MPFFFEEPDRLCTQGLSCAALYLNTICLLPALTEALGQSKHQCSDRISQKANLILYSNAMHANLLY